MTVRPPVPDGLVAGLVLTLAVGAPDLAVAQGHDGEDHDPGSGQHATHNHDGLHFTHPLFTESVSPDTKLRLDYGWRAGHETESEMEAEGELAFTPSFSIEAGVHYHVDDGALGDTHVIFKLASAALADAGVHLGYGLEIGLPTGTGHEHAVPEGTDPTGEEHEESYELTPFVNAGWTDGSLELVAWTLVEVPTDRHVRETAGTGLHFNGSALYHAAARVDAVLEAFGSTALSGSASEPTVVSLAPGLRVRPVAGPLVIAAGVAVPVTDAEYDSRVLLSVFWHF